MRHEISLDLDPAEGLEAIRPPDLGTTEEEMAWLASLQHAINRQGVDWAVSPGCSLIAPLSGDRLVAGDEVVVGLHVTLGQAQVLQRRNVLLRSTTQGRRVAACPPDARYVVAPGQAIISPTEGSLLAGAEVRAEWLDDGEQALLSLVARGVVIDRDAPPAPKLPEEQALRDREADLATAQSEVDAAVEALTADDNAKTQKSYVEKKLQLDLAGVRVGAARKAVGIAQAAEAERQRAELIAKIDELDRTINAHEADGQAHREAEVTAAFALARALRASYDHAETAYQHRIGRNALLASLHGTEMLYEAPPLTRFFQQVTAVGQAIDLDLTKV